MFDFGSLTWIVSCDIFHNLDLAFSDVQGSCAFFCEGTVSGWDSSSGVSQASKTSFYPILTYHQIVLAWQGSALCTAT